MMKRKKYGFATVIALSLFGLVMSCAKVWQIRSESSASEQEYMRLSEDTITSSLLDTEETENNSLTVDFNALLAVNPDCVGWIEIPGTEVSYPIVQGEDNDFYLRRSFEGRESVGGVLFLDYRSAEDFGGTNTVLYGHNMRDGSMFGSLKNYLSADFFKEHAEIHVYTPDGLRTYEVFTAYEATTGWDCFTFSFNSDLERDTWLQSQAEHGGMSTELNVYDEVLTLVTCKGGENEYRTIVQAVCKEKENNA